MSARSLVAAPLLLIAPFATLPSAAETAEDTAEKDSPRLSVETLFHPAKRIDFDGPSGPTRVWSEEPGRYYQLVSGANVTPRIDLVDARSADAKPFLNGDDVAAALSKIDGVSEEEAKRLAAGVVRGLLGTEFAPGRAGRFRLSEGRDALLLDLFSDLFHLPLGAERPTRLTHGPAEEVGEELSPDGRTVAFIRGNDLLVVPTAGGEERRLTEPSPPTILNGRLDWVYQEEVYGRGNYKGYWWSPDSRHLAFLQLDESGVTEFTVVDHVPNAGEFEVSSYPKAGTPNPSVRLGIVRAAGGDPVWIDTSRYAGGEHLIVRVSWTPAGDKVVFQVQDREQTWLDLNVADPATGEMTRLLRADEGAWVRVLGDPHWLDDGSFLWLAEPEGFAHVEHRDAKGKLLRNVTSGEWEVRTIHGIDEEKGRVYFSGTERTSISHDVYSVGLDGEGLTLLTESPGDHRASFSSDLTHFLDRHSDVTTPTSVHLRDAKGKLVRTVDRADTSTLEKTPLGEVRFLEVPAEDGFSMPAMMILPPGFDETKKYPVLHYVYGGPHAPLVRDRWGGTRYLWLQLLANEGYIVWVCDNRAASGRGIGPAWGIYERLGEVELADMEDGLDWLRAQPYVDAERIGIYGWSYGGYMTAYAMTRTDSYKAGISGAPVTDWRLYDTIYTERYMRRPQNNPDGYVSTSVVEKAADLEGKLFLVHGTMDDNVHFQNSVQLVYALQSAGKDFELMIYPRSRHHVHEPMLSYDLYRRMTRFLRENL